MSAKSSPDSITLTYDLLKWTIPTLKKFPRDQRFLLGDRIENYTLDILELLICANYSKDKLPSPPGQFCQWIADRLSFGAIKGEILHPHPDPLPRGRGD